MEDMWYEKEHRNCNVEAGCTSPSGPRYVLFPTGPRVPLLHFAAQGILQRVVGMALALEIIAMEENSRFILCITQEQDCGRTTGTMLVASTVF